MKIKQHCENGNVVAEENQYQYVQLNNRHWLKLDSTQVQNDNRTSYERHYVDNIRYSGESTEFYENKTLGANDNDTANDADVKLAVCNTLYRLNEKDKVKCSNTTNRCNTVDILYENTANFSCDLTETNSTSENLNRPHFENLDADEMSEQSFHQVPRGIVNPNYPGFQHLAHTLQDYSSTIENFYHSENDMTDDDFDIDLIDSTNESNFYQSPGTDESKNINNNNVYESSNVLDINCIPNDLLLKSSKSEVKNEVPDLLQTVTQGNNNNGDSCYGQFFSETDIENNFYKKDIIGDFNKEVEDEIKLLLNYNININDDLEELRKDIKDTFAKPIENTINNISDVVNHVIKKLVENDFENESSVNHTKPNGVIREMSAVNKDNETNTRIEMNLTRPSFLLLDTNPKNFIADAFLSDGKDEINTNYDYEIDTEHLSYDVENTIKQLSTELRKIIPKLDEMREHDKHWMNNRNEPQVRTDSNFNEIEDFNFDSNSSKTENKVESDLKIENLKRKNIRTEIRSSNDQKKVAVKEGCSTSSQRHVKSNLSVQKREKAKETSSLGSFDVYNIETALPKIDLDAIENHLKAAKEAERRVSLKRIS